MASSLGLLDRRQKRERARPDPSLEPPRECGPADTLISDWRCCLWTSGLQSGQKERAFLLFSSQPVGGNVTVVLISFSRRRVILVYLWL